MKLTDTAIKVLKARYLFDGESPEGMFRRVAGALANNLTEEEDFYRIMSELKFLPNSPCLINAGRPLGQLAACFVVPIEDNIESIFDAVKYAAIIHKSGGGTGFDFSQLRPANSTVASTRGVASGPVSFMEVFNTATEVIKQGGVRRGANMGILNITHPDILSFINCKRDKTRFNNFNISVMVTDDFMYDMDTKIWDALINAAWENGEPGVLFYDAINSLNPVPNLGPINATNPCGETPLLPWESCVLGSLNLANVGNIKDTEETIRLAVRFLDRIIDVNKYPLPQIKEATCRTRKIGLGVMGWADYLINHSIRYDCGGALMEAEYVMRFINNIAHHESALLADKHGPYDYDNFIHREYRRNATVTTIAPTGTLSMIAGCSSSIEPIYRRVYSKKVLGDSFPVIYDSIYAVPSNEILYTHHVKMQSAFQYHTDNAVSKTINLPSNAGKDDIARAIQLAWDRGCKGVTVYRDGSRDNQVLQETKNPFSYFSS